MATSTKSKKQKKFRYKKVTFKITEKQKKLIDRVCKKQKVTSNRLIKKAIREYLSRYAELVENEEIISKNQLRLFDDDFEDDEELSCVAEDTNEQ